MKTASRTLLAAAAFSLYLVQPAHAQDAPAAYVVTYLETTPDAPGKARALLKRLAEESRKADGNLRFEVLQRLHQPNHFAILEMWKGKEAQAAHASSDGTKQFRERLAPLLRSPYDERPHTGLSIAPQKDAARAKAAAVYVVTHVDIVPTEKDKGIGYVTELAQASRGDSGVLRYEVLQQNSRPNHLTLVEIWRNPKSLDAHGTAAHTRQFRERLTPLSGSLYDERLYKVLD